MSLRTCLAVAALSLLATACSNPIEGTWRSDKKLPNDQRNTMTVESDLTGKATIYATPAYDLAFWTKFKFEFKGVEKEDGYRWDFEMDCDSDNCNGDDFEMECKVFSGEDNGGLDKLNCRGDARWEDYPFDWERVEEE
ncbi:MAG: hypothetical protein JRI23_18205 [Deltaproteobacteria bacterium]|jgi:hypothetical protein|nr:hypothetical protein [Deltaproteobacteria bacterium]MBW2533788.1 hypothetical protein [Deltaproteobacteria bacterium]